jgi:AcrR family transcriptional regulator
MSRRKPAHPARKQPRQARAQVTFEAILDGTIRVLNEQGADGASTTRIAEVAGVSVGTLYQYFADREAIFEALQDREFERATAMLSAALEQDTLDQRQVAHAVIAGLLGLYRNAPGLHRLLAVNGMHVSPADRVVAFDRKIVETLRVFFELSPLGVTRPNKHAAAFVLYQSVRATLLAAILEEPSGLSDDVLLDEVTTLVVGHLMGRTG